MKFKLNKVFLLVGFLILFFLAIPSNSFAAAICGSACMPDILNGGFSCQQTYSEYPTCPAGQAPSCQQTGSVWCPDIASGVACVTSGFVCVPIGTTFWCDTATNTCNEVSGPNGAYSTQAACSADCGGGGGGGGGGTPNLTAGVSSPSTATVGVAQTFTATITNNGTASTGASFSNFFQRATLVNGGGTITDFTATTMTTLAASGTATATSPAYTFLSNGTYSVRACADKTSSAGGGVITELDENDNCSAWTNVTVTGGTDSSQCIDFTAPSTVTASQAFTGSVTVRNIGTNTWNTTAPYALTSPPGASWPGPGPFGQHFLGLPSSTVAPNTNATFAFSATAPSTANTYSFDFQMLHNGVAWFGPLCTKSIIVSSSNAVPTVTTPTVSAITTTSATLGANVTSLGVPAAISARGTCWGTTPAPTTNCLAQGGTTTGVFTHSRTGMTAGASYYYRGYAINTTGTGYSPDSTFTAVANLPNLTASAPTPTTATINVAQTFTSTITNNGTASTGASFVNLFQTSPSSTGASGVVDYPVSPNMSTLANGLSAPTSRSITFTTLGTIYMRACADKSSAGSTGTITESNENDNCSMSTPWTMVTVSNPSSATLISCVTDICTGATDSGYFYYQEQNKMISDYCLPAYDNCAVPVYVINGTNYWFRQDGKNTATCKNLQDPVPVCTAMSGTLTGPASCTIPLNQSTCNPSPNLSWSITNPEGTPTAITATGMTNINVSNTLTPASQSGVQAVTVPYNSRTFYLYNNAKSLVPTSPSGAGIIVTASCASGSGWNGTICAASVNGVCGNANGKTYPNGTSAYAPDVQCSLGNSSNTAFPPAGSSTSWICNGLNGGFPSGNCSASQTASPTVDIDATPTTIYTGGSTTLTWSCSAGPSTGTNFNTFGALSGSQLVSPVSTITYTVTCGGVPDSVTITVRRRPFFIEN